MHNCALLSIALVVFAPAYGQSFSDRAGLSYNLYIESGSQEFTVETISNFEITDYTFDRAQERLTIYIMSSLEDNLGEMQIPLGLLGGNYTVYLNDSEIHPDIRSNENISFVTLNFEGSGQNRIDIYAESDLDIKNSASVHEISSQPDGGGCLIATAAYGSELALPVQNLREIRDAVVMNTGVGAAFVNGFNQVYYAMSPSVADYQRENATFNEMIRLAITPLVASLEIMSAADSEHEVIGYGIVAILVNLCMYVVAPAMVLARFRGLVTR